MNPCTILDCKNKAHAKGMCASHYMKQRRYGDPLTPDRPRRRGPSPLENRLVDRWVIDQSGCWIWTGDKRNGYGSIWVNRERQYAHRVIFALHNGPVPAGMLVRHSCDVPACVNPAHLLLGTQKDNMADASTRERWANQFAVGRGNPRRQAS